MSEIMFVLLARGLISETLQQLIKAALLFLFLLLYVRIYTFSNSSEKSSLPTESFYTLRKFRTIFKEKKKFLIYKKI